MTVSKTKAKLVDVARQLFAKMGVENTTMNDIALASKKGRRTLYTYFKSKEDIYLAVVESERRRRGAGSGSAGGTGAALLRAGAAAGVPAAEPGRAGTAGQGAAADSRIAHPPYHTSVPIEFHIYGGEHYVQQQGSHYGSSPGGAQADHHAEQEHQRQGFP